MALSSQGSTFTFRGVVFTVTSVSVEAPTPEVVDMTSMFGAMGVRVLVPTGDFSSTGKIDVEAIGFGDPKDHIGAVGQAQFQTPSGTISRQVLCDAASVTGQVGDIFRFRISFTPTDFLP